MSEVHVTDSRRPLEAICEASPVMAQAGSVGNEFAHHGHAVHQYIERALAVGADEALAELPEDAGHRDHCAQLEVARIPKGARAEMALRWNRHTDKVTLLGYSIGRNYPPRVDGDEDGTIDLAALCEDADGRFAWVADVKTGFRSTGPTAENKQLRAGAMKLAKYHGVDRALISTLVRQDGERERDPSAWLYVDDLMAIAEELRERAARRQVLRARYEAGERLPVVEGPHCREMYCQSYSACWAKVEMVAAAARGQLVLTTGAPPIPIPSVADLVDMPPAQLGQIWSRSREVRKVLEERLETAIEAIASQTAGGLPLPSGEVLAEVEVANKAKVTPERVEGALRRVLPDDEVAKVLPVAVKNDLRATLSSIEDGLRVVAPRGQLTRLKERVREALRAEGGIVEGKHQEVKPVSPRRLRA